MQIMSQVNFTTVMLTKCDRCCSRNKFKLHGDLMLSVAVVILLYVVSVSYCIQREASVQPVESLLIFYAEEEII